jgi:hypothetical protein
MEEEIIKTSVDILLPVLESAIALGGNYAKKSGRDILTGTDLEYALKFCARHVTGRHIGTLFPEIQQDSDSEGSESECTESDDEGTVASQLEQEEPPFTRYTGDDETLKKVNECYDTWNDWVPINPTEQMLKKSIDSRQWT